jgi:hypothetical protein
VDSLMKVVRGEPPETNPLPGVPESETVDVFEGIAEVAGKSTDAEIAALALGMLEHTEVKPLIVAQQPLTPMFKIALALLGEPERLERDHFRSPDSNQPLQLAAVAAVVRCRGRAGLGFAVHYQYTAWWEPQYVAPSTRPATVTT